MLQFIFGRAGFGKTFKIKEIIKESLNSNKEKLMLLVPEQSSFDTERNILNLFGVKDAAKIQVMTFTRLIELVSRKLGWNFGRKINKGDRNLLMSLAIDEVEDKLEIYSGQFSKVELVELMVSALSEFKMCRVTNDSLLKISHGLSDPILKRKIQEISLILEAYNALLKNTYLDPLDDLTRLVQKLSEHNFFSGYTVMFDEFEGFTMQQLSILEIILKQCESCYITLCTDRQAFSSDEVNVFSPINRTAKRILNIAKKNYVTIKTPIYLETPTKFKSAGLKTLESQIFRVKKEKLTQKIDDVFIFNGNTKYDEADFVCRTIRKLICDGKYKYNDFAVITRNDEVYKGILDMAFEKYEIPYFMDCREDISSKPLMLAVLSAFEVINSNFSSQSVFKYLKTGLIGIDLDEIFELENYVLFWRITGKRWTYEFSANPDGYMKMDEKSKGKLLKINALRERIIAPLLKLKQNTGDTTGENIAKEIYDFLCNIHIIESLKNFCEELEKANQSNLAEEQVRLWNILIEILDKMAIILKNKKMSPKEYTDLLKLTLSSYDIAFIPKKIDEVTFGSIDRIRVQGKKVVFLIGAVEGEFPRVPATSGIFTDLQRKQLILKGLPIYDSIEGLAVNERFLAYRTVTMPSEKLYITWSSMTTLGGTKSESEIIKETKFILPSVMCTDDFSEEMSNKIWAVKPAFELCAKCWNSKSRFSYTLKEFFLQNDEYKEKLYTLEKVNSKIPFKVEDTKKIRALFGENMLVSATQIEKFYLCKFAYFCKYGLLANERRKASFDVLHYGNVVHFIFEKILKKFTIDRLLSFSKKELLKEVRSILNYYVDENLGGWPEKTERFRYLFNRISNSVGPLITHMAEELDQSKFHPIAFELEISPQKGINPLKFELPDGMSIAVGGKIDRVDVMHCGDKDYVRVIDYKTGAKEFNLSDIFYGLNLQMLIYLETFCKNFNNEHNEKVPAGALYWPANSAALNLDRSESLEKLEKEKNKKLRMSGLILDDKQAILGMEQNAKGKYIPVEIKDGKTKSCESLASAAQIETIMRHVDKLIISMATQLREGNINAHPAKGSCDACEFCEYKMVCVLLNDESVREVKNLKKNEFFEKLEQKEQI